MPLSSHNTSSDTNQPDVLLTTPRTFVNLIGIVVTNTVSEAFTNVFTGDINVSNGSMTNVIGYNCSKSHDVSFGPVVTVIKQYKFQRLQHKTVPKSGDNIVKLLVFRKIIKTADLWASHSVEKHIVQYIKTSCTTRSQDLNI